MKTWMAILVVLPVLVTVTYTYRNLLVWLCKKQRIYAARCERLEKLIHEMVDLAYVYDNDHTKFYNKFLEIVNIKSLRRRGIINPETMLDTNKFNNELKVMKRSDAELFALIKAGFSSREIKVIYGLKNLNSVYIKRHRLHDRLSKKIGQLLDS